LLRAGEVVEGVELARARRSGSDILARGPGRLGQALGVTAADSGVDLRSGRLQLSAPDAVATFSRGPRVGVSKAADWNWRFWIQGDPHVSPYRRSRRA
ncbi:MAG: DNA-3-methyladenine glycosylase, partial [Candidatus Nanopelagicales bacterium]